MEDTNRSPKTKFRRGGRRPNARAQNLPRYRRKYNSSSDSDGDRRAVFSGSRKDMAAYDAAIDLEEERSYLDDAMKEAEEKVGCERCAGGTTKECTQGCPFMQLDTDKPVDVDNYMTPKIIKVGKKTFRKLYYRTKHPDYFSDVYAAHELQDGTQSTPCPIISTLTQIMISHLKDDQDYNDVIMVDCPYPNSVSTINYLCCKPPHKVHIANVLKYMNQQPLDIVESFEALDGKDVIILSFVALSYPLDVLKTIIMNAAAAHVDVYMIAPAFDESLSAAHKEMTWELQNSRSGLTALVTSGCIKRLQCHSVDYLISGTIPLSSGTILVTELKRIGEFVLTKLAMCDDNIPVLYNLAALPLVNIIETVFQGAYVVLKTKDAASIHVPTQWYHEAKTYMFGKSRTEANYLALIQHLKSKFKAANVTPQAYGTYLPSLVSKVFADVDDESMSAKVIARSSMSIYLADKFGISAILAHPFASTIAVTLDSFLRRHWLVLTVAAPMVILLLRTQRKIYIVMLVVSIVAAYYNQRAAMPLGRLWHYFQSIRTYIRYAYSSTRSMAKSFYLHYTSGVSEGHSIIGDVRGWPLAAIEPFTTDGPITYVRPHAINNACNEAQECTPYTDKFTVFRPEGGKCHDGIGAIVVGLVDSTYVISSARTCTHNQTVAVLNRGVLDARPCKPYLWELVIRSIPTSILFDRLPHGPMEVVHFKDWLSRFTADRRARLQAGKNNVRESPGLWRAKLIRESHVKVEKDVYYDGDRVLLDPRLIQGATPEFQAVTGPVTHSLSKLVSQLWGYDSNWGPVTYASGMSNEMVGKWYDDALVYVKTPFIIENDFSRFDNTIRSMAFVASKYFYKFVGVSDKHLDVIFSRKIIRGVFRSGTYYQCLHTRCSGDGDTSVGNSIINGLVHHCLFQLLRCKYRIIVSGDDMLAVVDRPINASDIEKFLIALGFKPKTKIYRNPLLAEFCSARLWPCDHSFVLGPKPGRVVVRLGYTYRYLLPGLEYVWLKSVFLGLHNEVSHVPILNVYTSHYLKLLSGIDAQASFDDHNFRSDRYHEVSDASYNTMSDVYGLDRNDVFRFEELIKTITHPTVVVKHYVLDKIRSIDLPARSYAALFPQDQGSYSYLWLPVIEEVVKRIPYMKHYVIWAEFLLYVIPKPTVFAIIQRLLVVVLHYLWCDIELAPAILLHLLYNWCVKQIHISCGINLGFAAPPLFTFVLLIIMALMFRWTIILLLVVLPLSVATSLRYDLIRTYRLFLWKFYAVGLNRCASRCYNRIVNYLANNRLTSWMGSLPLRSDALTQASRVVSVLCGYMEKKTKTTTSSEVRRKPRQPRPPKRVVRPRPKVKPKQKPKGRSVTKAPVSYGTTINFSANRKMSTRIRHREMVTTIAALSTGAFNSSAFNVDPASELMFTWLPPVASRFEQYRFRYLRFEFVPSVSSSTNGLLALAYDPDAVDGKPMNLEQFTSYQISKADSVWKPTTIVVPPSLLFTKRLFVDADSDVLTSDPKTYIFGSLMVATQGGSVAQDIGYVFVDYDIELFYPQNETTSSYGSNGSRLDSTSAPNKAAPFSGSFSRSGTVFQATMANNEITFKNKAYRACLIVWKGTGIGNSLIDVLDDAANGTGIAWSNLHDDAGQTGSCFAAGFGNKVKTNQTYVSAFTTLTEIHIYHWYVIKSFTGLSISKITPIMQNDLRELFMQYLRETKTQQTIRDIADTETYSDSSSDDSDIGLLDLPHLVEANAPPVPMAGLECVSCITCEKKSN